MRLKNIKQRKATPELLFLYCFHFTSLYNSSVIVAAFAIGWSPRINNDIMKFQLFIKRHN